MKDLQGTEKQIQFASDIRAEEAERFESKIKKMTGRAGKENVVLAYTEILERLINEDSATWVINDLRPFERSVREKYSL